ncbi:hypothetical protein [Thermovibrio sp.]
MKRIYHLGVISGDRRTELLIDKALKVGEVFLEKLQMSPSGGFIDNLEPDLLVLSINSGIELKEKLQNFSKKLSVIVSEVPTRELNVPENVFFSSFNPLIFHSTLKALFKFLESTRNVKLKVKNGTVINLKREAATFKVEKLLPTGSKESFTLTAKEGAIVKEFFKLPGKVITYQKLIEVGVKKENIPVYISRIRKVLQKVDPMLKVKSLRNRGYYLSYEDYGL